MRLHPVQRCALRALCAIAATFLPLQGASAADRIVGRASVIDGNTLKIAGRRIGLYGIDAPEGGQTCTKGGRPWLCGQRAALALDDRIANGRVSCEPKRRDRYGGIVAVCRLKGKNLNAWMVAQGWALAYRLHTADYVRDERTASENRRGLWQGRFTSARLWRRWESRNLPADGNAGPMPPSKIGPPVMLIPARFRAQGAAAP